ncbi:MAG: tRNA uridine-5-carboxymethylaminomethyl(34) synthesis GTPase MnmE [Chitinophagaceae bacterium]|nr:tRNA uridine-5-carboxymethylaminomethyl(34) synthesis GTPase MnmE [Chitinophagaceae bacterium]
MSMQFMGWDDTIVALATAPGIGAIGVIRVSGTKTFEVINQLFPSKNLQDQKSHTIHVGLLKQGEQVLDEVVLSLYKSPKSYTGEDVIEISCHGSPFIQQQIIEAITERGVRLAKPGEFTQRAFLKGKLDLAQAEAVADLIASNTEASKRAALHTMKGGFSSDLAMLRESLIKFSALIELELDFSQEDVAFADRSAFRKLIDELQQAVQQLIDSFKLGNVIKEGVQVAIIGKPNAGKSTLLNTLLNENRAIVSDIAGTTRDTIEEVLNIGGVLFRLIDTAGIREHTADIIEEIGVSKSLEKMRSAQLAIYLFDAVTTTPDVLQADIAQLQKENMSYIVVGNKADSCTADQRTALNVIVECLFISARDKTGIESLKEALLQHTVSGDIYAESTIVTNARHHAALQQLQQSLTDIHTGLDNELPGDLLALDIRQALHYLGTITGTITHEDQLDFIFSKFCIGK